MPTLSVYVNDKIYGFLLKTGEGKPSAMAKRWIEERYKEETAI